MEIDFEELQRRAQKDNIDIELLLSYILTVENLSTEDPTLLEEDEAVDSALLGFYTWKRSEMIRKAAVEQDSYGNLFEQFEGEMNPGQRRLLERIAKPGPIMNYHVAGLVHAGERVKEFLTRFGATTPLNRLLKEYIFKQPSEK